MIGVASRQHRLARARGEDIDGASPREPFALALLQRAASRLGADEFPESLKLPIAEL